MDFMELEQQVTSLGVSKRLKELGVKQDGVLFVHLKTKHTKGTFFATKHIQSLLDEPGHEWCAAFTSSELGEMLPDTIPAEVLTSNSGWLDISKSKETGWACKYTDVHIKWEKNLADAMGGMLIYLIQNGFIKI